VISWNKDIHNNSLLGKGKIERFYLDVGTIIGNVIVHLSIVPMETLGVNISIYGRGIVSFWGGG